MIPIPQHLSRFFWYCSHLAWLVSEGHTPRHDPGDAVPRRANLRGSSLCRGNLTGANLRGADLTRTELWGTDFTSAVLTDTCLDPALSPNGDVTGFTRDPDDEAYVIGYRTRRQICMLGPPYKDGREYAAPVFSTAPTECHPGLYLQPSDKWLYEEVIRVRAHAADVHHTGDKWRCRRLMVLGAVKEQR